MQIFAHHTLLHSIEMNTQGLAALGMLVLAVILVMAWRREK